MTKPQKVPTDGDPACPHFGECAGCAMPAIDSAVEGEDKLRRLRRALRRAAPGTEELIESLDGPSSPLGHRSRLALRIEGEDSALHAGLPAQGRRGLVTIESCPASDPRAVTAGFAVVQEARQRRVEGVLAVVAHASSSDDLHVTLVAETGRLPHAQRLAEAATAVGATGVSLNVHEGRGRRMFGRRTVPLSGRPVRVERIADLEMPLGPTTFFETSTFGAERLVAAIRDAAPDRVGRLVDLYAGCGMLSLALADRTDHVVQVDASVEATRDAERCAGRVEAAVEIRRAPVDRELITLGDHPVGLAIVDPPPDGFDETVATQITRALRPRQILLVGRGAATFARDLARLTVGGYSTGSIVAIDADPLAREAVTLASMTR